jgi:PKD repeat protein
MTRRARPGRCAAAALSTFLLAAGLSAVALTVPSAVADTAPQNPNDPKSPVTVSSDALPTPQINGVVWDTAIVGNTVYAGGSFTNARPAGSASGQNVVARGNMVAFNVTTGVMTSFAPSFNGQIRSLAVSPDQTRLYVGGEFTSVTVGGTTSTRRRIAAFNTATGALITSFAPSVNYDVNAVTATNTTVYAGGSFLGVGSVNREKLAAFNASNGALLDWAPAATGPSAEVTAIVVNPAGTKVAVGGSFTALNGSSNPGYGLGMVDATTGANLPMAINQHVRNAAATATPDADGAGSITSLTTDGTSIFGTGYTYLRAGGTFEGTFSATWDGGAVNFINDCHGDTYDTTAIGAVVYSVGHPHYCENLDGFRQGAGGVGTYPYHRAIATTKIATGTLTWEPDQGRYYSFEGLPAPSQLGWFPDLNAGTFTGQSQGPWSVTGNSSYVVLGGEFTRVNGASQQGLVRFAVSSIAPNDQGPQFFNTTYPLNVSSTEAGKARINWGINRDSDNEYLTYRVYRDTQTAAGLIHTRSVSARYWNPFTMGFTDTGSTLTPGSTHQYRVQVSDPFGNVANSPWTSVTIAPAGAKDSAYVKAVYDSQPTSYWRLGEAAGSTTAADRVGFDPLTTQAGVTRATPGAISGDTDTASSFSGALGGSAAGVTAGNPPDVFSLETWFRTTTTAGGRLLGWSNRNTTANSTKRDRQLYMDNAGRLHFGVKPNANRQVVTSEATYNDGQWHHAVASLSKSGMKLYVDGAQVASRADVTVGEHLSIGYWRLGGDSLASWPSVPTSGNFAGSLDEVAIYKHELSATEVAAHHAAATGASTPNVKPIVAFSAQRTGLAAAFSSSGTSDPDGTIASYAWSFGDGDTATTANPSHTYTAAGTYTVSLTVTDDDGGSTTLTKQVQVSAPPVADFTTSVSGTQLSVDAGSSTDDQGVTSYAWTFGDGSTGTGVTASRTYAAGGTYNVTLTVTDATGNTATRTRQVTIVAANAAPKATAVVTSNGLTINANGSSSTDSDGTIASYAWTFGDGGTSTLANASHTYGAAGTYTVSLTVTDDDGATNVATQQVTVAPAASAYAQDSFSRSVTGGWGAADLGGAWSGSGTASNFNVTGGVGTIRMGSPGSGPSRALAGVSSSNTEMRATIGVDKAATGGGTYVTLRPRVVASGDRYFVDTKFNAGGSVTIILGRNVGATETVLQSRAVSGLTVTPTDRLQVRVQAFGTSPTTFRAKVWKVGTPEPEAWTASVSDTTAVLQAVGSIGVGTYLSGSATNAPVVASFDDLWAGPTP